MFPKVIPLPFSLEKIPPAFVPPLRMFPKPPLGHLNKLGDIVALPSKLGPLKGVGFILL